MNPFILQIISFFLSIVSFIKLSSIVSENCKLFRRSFFVDLLVSSFLFIPYDNAPNKNIVYFDESSTFD